MKNVPLGDVCQGISYGVTTSAIEKRSGPRLLRITDITPSGVDWMRVPGCEITAKEESKAKLKNGDILIARTGGTVGKSYLVKNSPVAIYASYLIRLRPIKTIILPEYMEVFLGSEAYWQQLRKAAQGAAQPNVNATVLSKIIIPLPNIEKQRQIATQLKAQLAEVEKARQAAEVQLCDVANLANAIIYDSLKSNKPTKYYVAKALEEIKQGIGQDWAKYPVLGATRNGLAPAKEPPGKNPHRYKPVSPGTVFYNPMRILIGSIAFVDEDDTPGITSPDYVALRGKQEVVDSRWFYYWLRSPLGEQFIKSLARGAVRERILFKRLAKGEIELPSFRVQRAASEALAALKPMQQAIEGKIKEINLLPEKILAKAFE